MAGWSFVVTPQPPSDYAVKLDRDAILAQWTTGASGIGWIERLADGGWAERVRRDGYPSVYLAQARDVVPLFEGRRLPSSGESTYEPWAVTVVWEELERLAPETALTVVVWDQS